MYRNERFEGQIFIALIEPISHRSSESKEVEGSFVHVLVEEHQELEVEIHVDEAGVGLNPGV